MDNKNINLEKIDFNDLDKSKSNVIFDTNFLFITFQFRIDLIADLQRLVSTNYDLYIYEGTLFELNNILKKKTKNKKFIPLINKMLKIYNFRIIKSDIDYVDKAILSNLTQTIYIATNDKELKKEIKKTCYNTKVIYLRQKSYLEIY